MPLLVTGQGTISSESPSPDTLLLMLTFPQPGQTDLISGQSSESKQFVLPDVSETLVILSGDAHIEVTIRKLEEKVMSSDSPIFPVDDISIGDEEKGTFGYKMRMLTERKWELETLNGMNGTKISVLRIYPWNLHPSKMQIRWIKQAVFQVVGKNVRIAPGNAIPADFLSHRATKESPPLSNPQPSLLAVNTGQSSQETFPPLKIEVDYEGIMIISQERIAEAGWEVEHVNPRFLRVIGKEGEIPIRVTGESDGLFDGTDGVEFWVEPLWDRTRPDEIRLDVFAEKNVYWLELGNTDGLRMAQEEGAVPGSQHETVTYPRSYPFSLHVEKDASFHRLPYAVDVDQGDYWFYSGPIIGGEKRSFTFTLHDPDNYAPQPVVVRIKLRGQSTSSLSHPFEIYVNDIRVGSGAWQGNEAVVLDELAFSSAYLKEGKNDLVVVNQSQEGVLAQLMLDWFEVSYPRFYLAHDNYLRFRAPEYSLGKVCRFQIDGFTHEHIEVYKKGISRIFGQEIKAVEDSTGAITYRVRFEDFIVDEKTEYVVLSLSKKKIPDALIQRRNTILRSSNRGASYVMIVSCDSLQNETLGELIQQRQSQGLQVEVVSLQSIYDEFNHGIPNPSAIRQFLQYTYHFWIPSPRSVLFVGDGYINCRAGADQGNLIPVVLYQTSKYGASASDHWYTLLDGEDAIPEIAIGRLPVRNQIELKHVVDKILQYERTPPGPWNNRYLLIGAGGSDEVFRQQSETMIHQIFHPSIHPERLYLTGDLSDPYVGGTEDLMRHLREGVFHVNFRGHGGGAIWSDAGLLDLDDVALIENRNKLPFITSMTCFTGDFTSSRMALGEALMLEKDVGCVAFWGSTGLGWLWNDYYLLKEFYHVLNAKPGLSIGEMLRRAKTAYLLAYGGDLSLTEVHQFTLLGDPAMHLPLPSAAIPIALEHHALAGQDTLVVTGSVESDTYHCLLEITDFDYAAKNSNEQQFEQNAWQMNVPIPSDFVDSGGGVRAHIWDPKTGYQTRGFVPFTIGITFFDSLKMIPEKPGYKDTIFFSVICEDPLTIQSLHCIVHEPSADTLEMVSCADVKSYVTIKGIGSLSPGSRLSFSFQAVNGQGGVSRSNTVTYLVPSLPDLFVQNCILTGIDRTVLEAWVLNRGEEHVASAQVRFECPQFGYNQEVSARFFKGDTAMVGIPILPHMGEMAFRITVDPDSNINESREENNITQKTIYVNRFNITPEEGSWEGPVPSDTVGIPQKVLCFVPPGAVSEKTTLLIEEVLNSAGIYSHMGLTIGEKMFSISLPGLAGGSRLLRDATLLFRDIPPDSAQMKEPYRWDSAIQRWIFCPYTRSGSEIRIQTDQLDFFRLIYCDDDDPPSIEIQVNNQPFADGSYVSRNPMFTVLFQDKSGVDIQDGKIGFYLDEVLQDPSSVTLPDSTTDPTHIAATFRPQLLPGQHTIYITASDVNGNSCQSETYSFQVASQLEIQYLGNHPNPFKWETVFVYVLTESVEQLELKIYTVSGRLIRTFDEYDFASADYHEIVWDGSDEWGNEVANGVYFFRIKAAGRNGQKEVTGKIAKIR